MYLYEQEGENDFLEVEESPMTLRLHIGGDESPRDANGADEMAENEGEVEEGEEGVEAVAVEEEEQHVEEAGPPETVSPMAASQTKTTPRGPNRKKQNNNLMQQLQLHMSPQQQQRFNASAQVC